MLLKYVCVWVYVLRLDKGSDKQLKSQAKRKENQTKRKTTAQQRERESEKNTETVEIIEVILLITQNVEYIFLSLSSARFIYLGKIIDLSFSVRSIQ